MADTLAGYRIIDLATYAAGPGAAAILGDLGADVIKVEAPSGDPYRPKTLPEGPPPLLPNLQTDNRSKRSIVLDLKRPEALVVFRDLVRSADVLIINLLPGSRDRMGLGYEELRAINDRLIYVSVTGYGSSGPDRGKPGFDRNAFWARSGMMHTVTEWTSDPVFLPGGSGDHTTSLAVLSGILTALLHREKTGRGQLIDVSLLATAMWVIGLELGNALHTGQQPSRRTSGQKNPLSSAVYVTKDDRWIVFNMPGYEQWWPHVAEVIGRPDVARDPAYATVEAIQSHIDEVIDLLRDGFAKRTLAEWGPLLDEHRLIWAPAATLLEVINDPQVKAMDYVARVEDPVHGSVRLPATPFKASETEAYPRGLAPDKGEHTEEILRELGYDDGRIAALRDSGTLG